MMNDRNGQRTIRIVACLARLLPASDRSSIYVGQTDPTAATTDSRNNVMRPVQLFITFPVADWTVVK